MDDWFLTISQGKVTVKSTRGQLQWESRYPCLKSPTDWMVGWSESPVGSTSYRPVRGGPSEFFYRPGGRKERGSGTGRSVDRQMGSWFLPRCAPTECPTTTTSTCNSTPRGTETDRVRRGRRRRRRGGGGVGETRDGGSSLTEGVGRTTIDVLLVQL